MTDNPQCIIEEQMNNDDETPGCELQKLLSKDGITVCASTALRWRQQQYIERHQLLLTDPGGERGEVTGMGNKKDRKMPFTQMKLLPRYNLLLQERTKA